MSGNNLELSELAKFFKPGIYRHFKGGVYEALFVGRHSENPSEEFIVYRNLENGGVWVRPIAMWFDEVDKAEYKGPRFIWVREKV